MCRVWGVEGFGGFIIQVWGERGWGLWLIASLVYAV